MRRLFFIPILFLALCSTLSAQGNFRIMFYNVENLFDTKDNPLTNDDDFLPKGNQRWTDSRYWKKLNDLSKAINAVGGKYPPALVGMCEIENDEVLSDLCKRSSLKAHRYSHVASKSKDDRGMNVGLLYQRDEMKVLKTVEYTPIFKEDKKKRTRNILHVVGKVVNGDTLDIFVCHFHSRVEGIKKTRTYRIQTAQLLRQKVDSLFKKRKNANVIIMGDFNDYPSDISLNETLNAKSTASKITAKGLYNMFYDEDAKKTNGSYKYRGKWRFLDQFIVSGNLLTDKNNTKVRNKKASLFSADFLLEKDAKYGGKKPLRMYVGWKYLGGTSDHLPIYIDLDVEE